MKAVHKFDNRFSFSLGERERVDIEAIKQNIAGCRFVEKTDEKTDRKGIDYIATLRGGSKVNIDAKARDKGCSNYWREGPELALETWSVIPEKGKNGKTGWTLSESSEVDLILFTFDPTDSKMFYLIPFQHLRMAFRKNCNNWMKVYKVDRQQSDSWRSECVFVPANKVIKAINELMIISA